MRALHHEQDLGVAIACPHVCVSRARPDAAPGRALSTHPRCIRWIRSTSSQHSSPVGVASAAQRCRVRAGTRRAPRTRHRGVLSRPRALINTEHARRRPSSPCQPTPNAAYRRTHLASTEQLWHAPRCGRAGGRVRGGGGVATVPRSRPRRLPPPPPVGHSSAPPPSLHHHVRCLIMVACRRPNVQSHLESESIMRPSVRFICHDGLLMTNRCADDNRRLPTADETRVESRTYLWSGALPPR